MLVENSIFQLGQNLIFFFLFFFLFNNSNLYSKVEQSLLYNHIQVPLLPQVSHCYRRIGAVEFCRRKSIRRHENLLLFSSSSLFLFIIEKRAIK